MTATLYGIPASHPVYAATLMLERKGIEYKRIDLPQWFHRPMLRALRFPGTTVPALVLDGRRVQTTKSIARALDQVKPEPQLVPDDPRVREIETWCDGDFQQLGRRLVRPRDKGRKPLKKLTFGLGVPPRDLFEGADDSD